MLIYYVVYPTTNVKWFKKFHRQTMTEILDSNPRLRVESYQKSQTELVSRLIIPEVEEMDTGAYSCHVGQELKVRRQIGHFKVDVNAFSNLRSVSSTGQVIGAWISPPSVTAP